MIKVEAIKELEARTIDLLESQNKKSMPADAKIELDKVVEFLCGVIDSKDDAKYGYAKETTVKAFLSKVYYCHPAMRLYGECMFRSMFQLLFNATKYFRA